MTNTIFKIRLKEGDTVIVRAGKDKGKSGKVLTASPRPTPNIHYAPVVERG